MRVLIADSRPKVRFALSALLAQHTSIEIAGEAATVEDLFGQVAAACPDVVLLDADLDRMEVGSLARSLHARCPTLRVIVLSGRPEARSAALDGGADAFVSKADPPERLLDVLRAADASPENGPAQSRHRAP